MRSCRSLAGLCLSLPLSLAACQTPPGEGDAPEEEESLPQALFTRPPIVNHASNTWLQANEGLQNNGGYDPEEPSTRLLTHYTVAGLFKLQMRADSCSLVLTQTVVDGRGFEHTKQLWTSANIVTIWQRPRKCYAWFQPDGNFVVYGEIGQHPWPETRVYSAIWSSNTWKHPGAQLVLENTGNVAIYAANGQRVWQTNTAQPPLPEEKRRGTSPIPHEGCRPARTDTKCGFPPDWPLGAMVCKDVYVCRSNGPDREESDQWYPCGICGRGRFQ